MSTTETALIRMLNRYLEGVNIVTASRIDVAGATLSKLVGLALVKRWPHGRVGTYSLTEAGFHAAMGAKEAP